MKILASPADDGSDDSAWVPNPQLRAAFEALSPEYRELIRLRYVLGASWEEVAARIRRPSTAAARMLHARALLELARWLREQGTGADAVSAAG